MRNLIYPCLWFDGNIKEAAEFYVNTFRNSEIINDTNLVIMIESHNQKIMLLNGGPYFKPNPSISFYVVCETEDEINHYWNSLSDGGMELMPLSEYDWSKKYGWVQDKYGISWQLGLGNFEDVGQKFTPSIMFVGDNCGRAESAIETYSKIFNNSSLVGILYYSENDTDSAGLVKHAQFKLNDNVFMVMESSYNHRFELNEGISLVVECDTQDEIDYFWEKLTDGGSESMCGWLKDKFGVSWQIVPAILSELMDDPEKSPKVVEAFMKMKKFDIQSLLDAAN